MVERQVSIKFTGDSSSLKRSADEGSQSLRNLQNTSTFNEFSKGVDGAANDVSNLRSSLTELRQSNTDLAASFRIPVESVRDLNKNLGTFPEKTARIATEYRKLQSSGTSAAEAQKILADTTGINAQQFEALQRNLGPTADQVAQYKEETRRAAEEQQKLAQETKEAAEEQQRLAEQQQAAARNLAVSLGVAGAAIGVFFQSATDQSAEYERSLNRIDQLIRTTGGSARQSTEGLQAFANQLGNDALTSEEAVLEASASLLTFRSIAGESFTRTIGLAQDMSEVFRSDLRGSTVQLAKALEDPITGLTALRRTGVSFTEEQKELIRTLVESGELLQAQSLILDVLESQFGGAGIAAAQGYAGALDTLGENLNDFRRTAGDLGTDIAQPVVNALSELLEGFNNLPEPVQRSIFLFTGLFGVLSTATAAVIGFQIANKQLEIVQTAVLVRTQALTAAKTAYAIATGTATVAQQKLAASVATTAAKLGVLAAAVGSIALIADTFIQVDEAAAGTRDRVEAVEGALNRLDEVNRSLAASADDVSNASQSIIERNRAQIEEDIGAVQRTLDIARNFLPGIASATEASVNRQSVAFGELISSIEGALGAYDNLNAAGLENASTEQIDAQLGAIEESIAALEAERPVTEEAVAAKETYLATLNRARESLEGFSSAQLGANQNISGAIDALKAATAESDAIIEASQRDQIIAIRRRQSEQLDAEALTSEEIQRINEEAARAIASIQDSASSDRLNALREELREIEALRSESGGEESEDLVAREREIQSQISEIQLSRVESQIQQQERLRSEAADAAERAEQEAERAAEERQRAEEERIEAIKQEQLDRIDEVAQAAENAATEQQQALEQESRAQEQITDAISRQVELLRSRANLQDAIASATDSAFNIAAQLTEDEAERAQIEEEAAEARVTALERSQVIERQIFELGLERRRVELEIEAIRLRAAQAQNRADEARAIAAIETAQVEGASAAQLQALQLELQAVRQQGIAIDAEQQGLSQQGALLERQNNLDRQAFNRQQQTQLNEAIADSIAAIVDDTDRARASERFRNQSLRRARQGGEDSGLGALGGEPQVLGRQLAQSFSQSLNNQSLAQPSLTAQPVAAAAPPATNASKNFEAAINSLGDRILQRQATITQSNEVNIFPQSASETERDTEDILFEQLDGIATALEGLVN